uniref:non-specific serine/threonine protein kinase n=1 Tax=Steinernema glaseri TaxID=37863 RepID=A0A1I8A1B2_9BILA
MMRRGTGTVKTATCAVGRQTFGQEPGPFRPISTYGRVFVQFAVCGNPKRRPKPNRGKAQNHRIDRSISDSSWLLGANTTSNLVRLRNSSLGRSDPQISASCQSRASVLLGVSVSPVSSVVKMRKPTEPQRPASRRSLNVSTSPTLVATTSSSLRCRSPAPVAVAAVSAPRPCPQPAKPSHNGVALRGASSKSGSSLAPFHHLDNRRWSLASLPSSSGYGTPGSNSAFSSQYSSQEHLCEMFGDMRLGGRYDSNDSCPSFDDAGIFRPRSRSLHSPMRLNSQTAAEIAVRSTIYKERFPKAKSHMEDRLKHFIEEHAALCGFTPVALEGTPKAESPPSLRQQKSVDIPTESTLTAPTVVLRPRSSSGRCAEGPPKISEPPAMNRRSMIETVADPTMVRLISDGATRFLLHQIVEIAADCLFKSKEDIITCAYFCDMSQRLEDTLAAAQDRTGPDSYTYLSKLVKQLLMTVSRPARLLECLEFDPDEFYHLLEEAEGAVREKLGSGNARVPDLPQYIVGKLGLDRDPLMDIPPSDEENDDAEPEKIEPEMSVEGPDLPKIRAPCEEDFDTIRLVSNGAYGAVYLVRHKETKQRFALKKMNKHTLILRNQVDQVYAERDILTFTDNPFVVSFYGSFETKHHLCMLMEYVEGGDCAALLKTCGTLPYDLVRLYMAETVLAIEYLHSYGIVHRDLKPDNLLITAMGHIKLTDFGLSKIGLMSRTTLVSEGCMDVALSAANQQFRDKQLCGTPEYIAPEVILRQGYGNPVDWWALGIILYEFLVGIVPFLGDTPEELFSNIISEEVLYPTDEEALPVEAEHLIRSLLEKNPLERLGMNFGATELMAHSFFEGLDFNSLLRQKAEFVPNLENEEDTSYFDIIRHIREDIRLTPTPLRMKPDQLVPSAVLLRRRFSAQRQSNLSTSSSGTAGTPGGTEMGSGTGWIGTSTDSSIDASSPLQPLQPRSGFRRRRRPHVPLLQHGLSTPQHRRHRPLHAGASPGDPHTQSPTRNAPLQVTLRGPYRIPN